MGVGGRRLGRKGDLLMLAQYVQFGLTETQLGVGNGGRERGHAGGEGKVSESGMLERNQRLDHYCECNSDKTLGVWMIGVRRIVV